MESVRTPRELSLPFQSSKDPQRPAPSRDRFQNPSDADPSVTCSQVPQYPRLKGSESGCTALTLEIFSFRNSEPVFDILLLSQNSSEGSSKTHPDFEAHSQSPCSQHSFSPSSPPWHYNLPGWLLCCSTHPLRCCPAAQTHIQSLVPQRLVQ